MKNESNNAILTKIELIEGGYSITRTRSRKSDEQIISTKNTVEFKKEEKGFSITITETIKTESLGNDTTELQKETDLTGDITSEPDD